MTYRYQLKSLFYLLTLACVLLCIARFVGGWTIVGIVAFPIAIIVGLLAVVALLSPLLYACSYVLGSFDERQRRALHVQPASSDGPTDEPPSDDS